MLFRIRKRTPLSKRGGICRQQMRDRQKAIISRKAFNSPPITRTVIARPGRVLNPATPINNHNEEQRIMHEQQIERANQQMLLHQKMHSANHTNQMNNMMNNGGSIL